MHGFLPSLALLSQVFVLESKQCSERAGAAYSFLSGRILVNASHPVNHLIN